MVSDKCADFPFLFDQGRIRTSQSLRPHRGTCRRCLIPADAAPRSAAIDPDPALPVAGRWPAWGAVPATATRYPPRDPHVEYLDKSRTRRDYRRFAAGLVLLKN